MPWKDISKRHAYQKKWYARKKSDSNWFAKKSAQRKETNRKRRSDSKLRYIEDERHNAHNWRNREWEHKHRSDFEILATKGSGLRVVSMNREKNPKFKIITKNGAVKTEMLFEPFPTWGNE